MLSMCTRKTVVISWVTIFKLCTRKSEKSVYITQPFTTTSTTTATNHHVILEFSDFYGLIDIIMSNVSVLVNIKLKPNCFLHIPTWPIDKEILFVFYFLFMHNIQTPTGLTYISY